MLEAMRIVATCKRATRIEVGMECPGHSQKRSNDVGLSEVQCRCRLEKIYVHIIRIIHMKKGVTWQELSAGSGNMVGKNEQ